MRYVNRYIKKAIFYPKSVSRHISKSGQSMSLLQNVPFPFVPMMAKDIKKASSIMINNDFDIEI